ncbi:hypothetical protein FB446DRAFT_754547 [Lentinula raphanica]|nr:hypothetical protein FB446DRAFT_754547 [Lentinula raphanica]
MNYLLVFFPYHQASALLSATLTSQLSSATANNEYIDYSRTTIEHFRSPQPRLSYPLTRLLHLARLSTADQ